MGKLENEWQSNLIKRLKDIFPGCIVVKNDPNYIQGIPDLTIFFKEYWATLECKKDFKAPARPNQSYYVYTMDQMSFSRFIYPENEEEVINDLQRAFKFIW